MGEFYFLEKAGNYIKDLFLSGEYIVDRNILLYFDQSKPCENGCELHYDLFTRFNNIETCYGDTIKKSKEMCLHEFPISYITKLCEKFSIKYEITYEISKQIEEVFIYCFVYHYFSKPVSIIFTVSCVDDYSNVIEIIKLARDEDRKITDRNEMIRKREEKMEDEHKKYIELKNKESRERLNHGREICREINEKYGTI